MCVNWTMALSRSLSLLPLSDSASSMELVEFLCIIAEATGVAVLSELLS